MLPLRVMNLLQEHDVPATQLLLEVTESTIMREPALASRWTALTEAAVIGEPSAQGEPVCASSPGGPPGVDHSPDTGGRP